MNHEYFSIKTEHILCKSDPRKDCSDKYAFQGRGRPWVWLWGGFAPVVARLRLLWGVADKDYWRVSKEIQNYHFWILKKKNPGKWYKTDFLLIYLSFLFI